MKRTGVTAVTMTTIFFFFNNYSRSLGLLEDQMSLCAKICLADLFVLLFPEHGVLSTVGLSDSCFSGVNFMRNEGRFTVLVIMVSKNILIIK